MTEEGGRNTPPSFFALFLCLLARPLSHSDMGAAINGARLVQSRQPIFNVPPVVVAVLVALGVVHAVRV